VFSQKKYSRNSSIDFVQVSGDIFDYYDFELRGIHSMNNIASNDKFDIKEKDYKFYTHVYEVHEQLAQCQTEYPLWIHVIGHRGRDTQQQESQVRYSKVHDVTMRYATFAVRHNNIDHEGVTQRSDQHDKAPDDGEE
jgi:hypothetical protein